MKQNILNLCSIFFILIAIFYQPLKINLEALPAYIPLQTRFAEADVVIEGDVIKVSSYRLNSVSRSATLRVRLRRVLKGERPPEQFSLSFLVFPNSFEGKLRKPPGVGRYFIFLNIKKVRDNKGRGGTAVVLYRPHPFSYAELNAENIKLINSLMKKKK